MSNDYLSMKYLSLTGFLLIFSAVIISTVTAFGETDRIQQILLWIIVIILFPVAAYWAYLTVEMFTEEKQKK